MDRDNYVEVFWSNIKLGNKWGRGGDSFESVDRDWVLFLRFIILIEKVCFLYILNWKKGISFK